ncbi:MAG TPA: ChaN family lipoprotein [Burkholderiales bacterium]|nr:ChaN family lipoprotein [Burkholderiales bacterium]
MKLLATLGLCILAACARPLAPGEHPLVGRIWDVRAERYVAPQELFDRAARARHVILGEMHDNPEHHRLQRVVLEALAARGGKRQLAMEQFDTEYQAAIDAARARGADVEAIADAGHFDRRGWNWPLYRPLVAFALEQDWPLAAANLSRDEARANVADPARANLPQAPAGVKAALERDIIDGHCGAAPEAKMLAGMVEAQRARDARMASVLKSPSVLIAGAGHAQRDRGVPLYAGDGDVLSVAFIEAEEGNRSASDYDGASYDYLWFTPRAARADPCADQPRPSRSPSILGSMGLT